MCINFLLSIVLQMAAQILLHFQPNLRARSLLHPSIGTRLTPWRGELGFRKGLAAVVLVSSDDAPVLFSETLESQKIGVELEFGGGDDGRDINGKGYEGGGGSGGNDEDGDEVVKKVGMSMSQKLILGYAACIGLGVLMGYFKSGSLKSLVAGRVADSLLLFVYSQLRVRPALASVGLSAALLVVMGSRFYKSGKVFPYGVVSLVSFIMTGGYFHGLMRGR